MVTGADGTVPRPEAGGSGALGSGVSPGQPMGSGVSPGQQSAPPRRPLRGVRVADLTRFVAGSQATMWLAALGAEVVKVEPPAGDPYRAQGTERAGGESVLFMALNAGKRSVAVDFRDQAGREVMGRLLSRCDLLVENSRPGSLAAHGLDWESVHRRFPRLVYGSISGYGDVGPEAGRGGFDLILQAESGVMSVTGSPQSGPVKVGAPFLDVGAGLSCAFGLLAGYIERLRTGTGCLVSASLLEFGLAGLGTVLASPGCSARTRRCSRRTAASAPRTAGWSWRVPGPSRCGGGPARP
jgi:crotonobetainyl-CoA:carnitine CoA-transferase CaiB-like acyl-CoA transferase